MNGSRSGTVLVLGNFDGVHRGHQALIAAAKVCAELRQLPLTALTFEPHPRRFFAPALPPFRLTSAEQKVHLLRAAGCDQVRILTFDGALAGVTAEDFARRILRDDCGARAIIAGEDFRFGHQRGGDMSRLKSWLEAEDIEVRAVALVRDPEGQRYAASTVRALLQTGQARAAAAILGRPYCIVGTIATGDQRGRQLGFPTANIALGEFQRPQYGVYAVRARPMAGGAEVHGVANIGRRPTVGGLQEWLEVHLFDFAADIYQQVWEITLVDFVRPEQKFADLNALQQQITRDIKIAQDILQT